MYLGIDIGTSSVKIILMNEDQQVLATHSEALTVACPLPLWSEQNPQDWWQAVQTSLVAIRTQQSAAYANIRSIGLTGQMHGAVCLDKRGQVLRPAILWNDGRSHAECAHLMQHTTAFRELGGNCVMPGFTAPKLLWLHQHEPDLFKKIAKVLLPKDYIRYCLTGELSTDMSDASGTLWLDIYKRQWSHEMLAACHLDVSHMPRLQEGTECSACVQSSVCTHLGFKNSVKVVAGAADNAAGALSMGIYKPKQAMLSLGTSGVYFTPVKQVSAQPDQGLHSFCHALPNSWHQMGVILSAASSLAWWQKIHAELSAQQLLACAQTHNAKHVPIFLPYLSGERTPHNNPFAKGCFIGMSQHTGQAELTQAVLEGVAFAMADCQKVIQDTGTQVDYVAVIGGGAQSSYWGQIMATILKRPLHYHSEAATGAAFGAARLALYEDKRLALAEVFTLPPLSHTIDIQSDRFAGLMQRFVLYQQAYKQLQPMFN